MRDGHDSGSAELSKCVFSRIYSRPRILDYFFFENVIREMRNLDWQRKYEFQVACPSKVAWLATDFAFVRHYNGKFLFFTPLVKQPRNEAHLSLNPNCR